MGTQVQFCKMKKVLEMDDGMMVAYSDNVLNATDLHT